MSQVDPQTQSELAAALLKLVSGKKRKEALKLLKEEFPATPIPELDMDESFNARLKEETEPLKKQLEEAKQERMLEKMAAEKARYQQQFGLSADDMSKVDKMITEKELPPDYKWATQLYKQQAEPAGATNYGTGGYGPAELPTDENLLKDEFKWSNKEAHTIVEELRKRSQTPSF